MRVAIARNQHGAAAIVPDVDEKEDTFFAGSFRKIIHSPWS